MKDDRPSRTKLLISTHEARFSGSRYKATRRAIADRVATFQLGKTKFETVGEALRDLNQNDLKLSGWGASVLEFVIADYERTPNGPTQ